MGSELLAHLAVKLILFWVELHIAFIHFGLHPDQDLILFEPLAETLQTPSAAFHEQIHR